VLTFVFGCTALFMMLLHHYVETCMENKRLKFVSIMLLAISCESKTVTWTSFTSAENVSLSVSLAMVNQEIFAS